MPNTQQIKTRIEAAQAELAKAQEELAEAEKPRFDPDRLYLVSQSTGQYLVRGRDFDVCGRFIRARDFVYLTTKYGQGQPTGTAARSTGLFHPDATITKLAAI
jgi:hypothetical protein